MLSFDRSARRRIQFYEEEWSKLAQELGGTETEDRSRMISGEADKWKNIKQHLNLVEKKELILTPKQIERIIFEYNKEKSQNEAIRDEEIEGALRRIKEVT
jgi:hypothetical protein